MAKDNNLTDFLADVADAIREKKGTSEPINPQDFSAEIASIKSGGNGWTGHADAEGLRAIGWTEEDIAYYQEHGVDWNEEDDHLHLVSDDNKALYGVLTADNISSYKNRIVYLPKIDIPNRTSMYNLFKDCYYLVAIPALDWTNAGSLYATFENCVSLTSISPIVAPNLYQLYRAFYNCSSLKRLSLTTYNSPEANYAFYRCSSLHSISSDSLLKFATLSNTFANCGSLQSIEVLDTSVTKGMNSFLSGCYALRKIQLDMSSASSVNSTLDGCVQLSDLEMSNLSISLSISESLILSKDSLLYVINNEASTSPITITLATNVYDKYATDPDVVEALGNHPNITLAK